MKKKNIALLSITLMFIFILVGCGSSSSNNIKTGQRITLSDDLIVCDSKSDEDKFSKYAIANNIKGEQEMLNNGEAVTLSKGTEVNVVDAGITVAEIETSDGKDYYVEAELVK